MDISINSFPRSGSQFAKFNLDRIIGLNLGSTMYHDIVTKKPPSLFNISRDENSFQIVIVRNPRDTVLSCVAHAEYSNPGSEKDITRAVRGTLAAYSRSLEHFLANIDYIELYDFDQLEWAIFDIANRLGLNIPDDFILEKIPYYADPNFWSVANTDFYKKLLKYRLDEHLFDEATEKYREILKICKRPTL